VGKIIKGGMSHGLYCEYTIIYASLKYTHKTVEVENFPAKKYTK